MSADFQGRTILVIDDTPENLSMMADHLVAQGFRVLSAQDGEEGFRRAKLMRPDLILLDVMMPGIDGFETCRQLMDCESTRSIPIIFMTTLSENDDKIRGFAVGGVDYVTKPFQVEEVMARVKTHLALRAAQRQLADQNTQLQAQALFRMGQNHILDMISTNAPLNQTLADLTTLIEFQAAGMRASILLLDEDGQHVCHCVAPSLPGAFCQAVTGLAIGPRVGSCGTAMYLREQVVVSDILQDPLWQDYRDVVAPYGLRASWSTPIISEDEVLGSFAMYYCEARHPSAAEKELIDVATHIAQIAIERHRAQAHMEHMKHMASHDALTGLPNRMLLGDRLEQGIVQAHRNRLQLALLLIDLDRFKHVNDTLGHHAGDLLLQIVAERLRSCLREGDSVARLGGDEFVVLLPSLTESRHAALVAEKILDELTAPFEIGEHELLIGGSIGISLFPSDGEELDALLRAADVAMYEVKGKGRSDYRFFRSPL